jgi:DNA polymerase I
MRLSFQLIDCDYILVDNKPIVRLFGKTKDGKSVCGFYKNFLPYFYVLPKPGEEESVIKFAKEKFNKNLVNIERVKKLLSIGYSEEKKELLKFTLNDPSQTPLVRDTLKQLASVQEIFEADILFKYRFMADYNISGMKWLDVSGSAANTTIVKTNRTITIDSIENSPTNENVEFKYMSIDIEVVSSDEGIADPSKDSIAMISISFHPSYENHNSLVLVAKSVKKTNGDVMVFQNEKSMLNEFLKIIDKFDPDVILGYNVNNFDIPFIVERLKANKTSKTLGRCNSKQIVSKKFGIKFRNSVTGRVIVDVYDLIKESVGKGLLRLKRYGLGDVSRELLKEEKVGITHSEIGKYWNGNAEQMEKLIEYARKDSDLALKLLMQQSMLDKFIELSKVSGLLLQDALDGGEATRIENLLLREFDKLGYVIPLRPSDKMIYKYSDEREAMGLKGALVLDPAIGLHTDAVVYLDFKSMYPSIYSAYNICPTTLLPPDSKIESIPTPYGTKFASPKIRRGIIPEIVKTLIDERDKVKKQMHDAKDENKKRALDARQFALKIMANAFYGYTGYVRARFYVLDIANAITSCGRDLIQKTKKIIEEKTDYKVVYGDTDSVMVKLKTKDLDEAFKNGYEVEKIINKELEGTVQIKIESVFKTLLVLNKKRYAGLSYEKINGEWKEKIVMKGIETVRRDWCDLVSESLYRTLEIVLKEQKPKDALNYIKTILIKLEKNEIPIEKLVITKSVSKPLHTYKGIQPHVELVKKLKKRSPSEAPGMGDRIGYVIVKGLQLMSDRAEDPDYVKQHNLKIDSKYYIESQILPPLERVFEAIGIGKAELIGAGKQLILLDAFRNKNVEPKQTVLDSIDGFICDRCNKNFRRVPLLGKCIACGGEILFHSNGTKSRYLMHGHNTSITADHKL